MSDTINKAKELGNSIVQSKEFISYLNKKEIIREMRLENEAALYERAEKIITSNKFSIDDKIYIDAKAILENAKNNNELIEYFRAKKDFSLLLEAVNQTLAHITGMDVSGNCGGCNGCSGCK